MSKFDQEKVLNHLSDKWKDSGCPMCKSKSWVVEASIFQLMEYNEGGLRLGGPIIPILPVTCKNCGLSVLVNAIVVGLIQAPSSASQEK